MSSKKNKRIKEQLLTYTEKAIFPGFSLDCVILAFHKGKIRVLLRKFEVNDDWALLGGFMLNSENADEAAHRALREYTNSSHVFLKQFKLFSAIDRTINNQNIKFAYVQITESDSWDWLVRRFITMGYFALVRYDEINLPPEPKMRLKWFDIKNLPSLYADHQYIINTAIESIRTMLPVLPIGYELLPEKFTMTELRQIYEIILDKTLDRRNFQRKVLSEGNVVQLEEKKDDRKYNPPSLFSFKKENIDLLNNDNIGPIT